MNRDECVEECESSKHCRYLDTLFNPKPLKWCIVFLCILGGFIFSCHRPFRLWNAVFIEAVTVVKMTGVWSHPVLTPPILLWETLIQWVTWDSVQQDSSVTLTRANGAQVHWDLNYCLFLFLICLYTAYNEFLVDRANHNILIMSWKRG